MNILLIFDKNFNINQELLSNFLSQQNFQSIVTTIYEKNIEIKERFITKPSSFNQITNNITNKESYDRIIVFTNKQYADNYFFHTQDNTVICSFHGWEYFTNLNKSNGIIYFIIDILALEIDASFRHQELTGCIYDFLWEKVGIDNGMRDAIFCESCKKRLKNSLSKEKKNLLKDIEILMKKLSNSSKNNQNILSTNDKKYKETTFSASDIKITNESISISRLIKKLKKNTIKLNNTDKLWNEHQMGRFIESILLKLPLPPIYFDVSNPKKWEIIDGLNRLNTLQKFVIKKSFHLTDLEFLKKLNDKNYNDLNGVYKRIIDETAITTYQVGIQTPKAVRDSIANRINSKKGTK